MFRREINLPGDRVFTDRFPSRIARFLPLRRPADLIHTSYFRKAVRGPKFVVTVHDMINEMFGTSARDRLLAYLKRQALRRADAIVCVSRHTRNDMERLYPWTKEKRTVIVPNGVDEEFGVLNGQESPLVADCDLRRGSFLLYVGGRGRCKNFPGVIGIFDKLRRRRPDLHLILVGGGPLSSEEGALFSKHLDDGTLRHLQDVETRHLNALYNNALALTMPSLYEGFGIPALEAARVGCITLGGATSSMTEVLGPSPFLFDPSDPTAVERACDLLDDPAVVAAERMRLVAHSHGFSWQSSTEQILTLYDELLR
jgi:mannosyltransferase